MRLWMQRWRTWKKVELPTAADSNFDLIPSISARRPKFVRNVLGQIAAGRGDLLPVSAIPAGGAFPTGTARGRNAILRSSFRSGTRTFAFSAASA